MVSKPEILDAMQFAFFTSKDPINTTGSARDTITWQYAGTSEPVDLPTSSSFDGWSEFATAEKAAFDAVLAHIETFLNVDFVEVTGSDDPDLNVGKVTLAGSTTGMGGPSIGSSGTKISRWDGFAVYDNTLDLSLASQTNLLLHELGHALGLKHPFSTPGLPEAEENNKFSVMSYTANPDNGEDGDAMMLYDVFALQDIWGGADNLGGDTSYTGKRTDTVDTVWDTGGTDIFDASAISNGVALDLREGSFSRFGSYEDVVIAFGTKIENATGGAGGDTVTGNGLANVLKGLGGKDKLLGGGGGDTLKGGGGRDTIKGEKGNDKLEGGGGRDKLIGGGGKDILAGEGGNDKLKGGKGADQFVFAKGDDKDTIRDFADDVDEIKITGLGTASDILAKASDVGGDVVIDFGDGDVLTILDATVAAISDDILT